MKLPRIIRVFWLVSGLRGVSLMGIVHFIGAPRTFDVRGRPKRVVRIIVGDKRGNSVHVSIWNDSLISKVVEGVRRGSVIKISGGTVRKTVKGVELMVSRGDIEIIGKESVGVLELEDGSKANFTVFGKIVDVYKPLYDDGSYRTAVLLDTPEGIYRLLALRHHQDDMKPGALIEVDGTFLEVRKDMCGDVFLGVDSSVKILEEEPITYSELGVADVYKLLYSYGTAYVNVVGRLERVGGRFFLCGNMLCIPLYSRIEGTPPVGDVCLRGVFATRLSSGRPVIYFDKYSAICEYKPVVERPVLINGESYYVKIAKLDELSIDLEKMGLSFTAFGYPFRAGSWLLERLLDISSDIEEILIGSVLDCIWGPGGFRVRAFYGKDFKDVDRS